ncbi:hypothetical protein ACFXTN_018059 [Malus domestica]
MDIDGQIEILLRIDGALRRRLKRRWKERGGRRLSNRGMGGGGSSGRDCLCASCGWKMNLVGLGDEFDGAVLHAKMNLEVRCGLCCGVESSEKKQRKRIRVVRERQSHRGKCLVVWEGSR